MSCELLLGRYAGQAWAALLEAGRPVELHVEPAHGATQVGRIIKARVTRILPGIDSAFLDIGTKQDGFLPVRDLLLPGESTEQWEGGRSGSGGYQSGRPIQERLSLGQDLLIQVARDTLGTKGARVTCNLSLAGRLLVLFPMLSLRKVSRKIKDPEERERLIEIASRLPGGTVGFVVRTAALDADEAALQLDAAALLESWQRVQQRTEAASAPCVLQDGEDLISRLLRDIPREALDRIIVEETEDRGSAMELLNRIDPVLASRVEMHTGRDSLFRDYGIGDEFAKALRPKVWLKSGGYLVIEPTEALVSIDVNTGKFVGRSGLAQTALKTNLEAAGEIARQLRLRGLGGVIVIDFIDMETAESQQQVIDTLVAGLGKDRARTRVFGFSELGLLQLTRKRSQPGLREQLTKLCTRCEGSGRIRAPISVASAALAEVQRLATKAEGRQFSVSAHPDVVETLHELLPGVGAAIAPGVRVEIEPDSSRHFDEFEVRIRETGTEADGS